MAFMAARRRLTILRFLEPYLVAKTVSQDYQTHLELSQIKARKRIESGGDSRDGMEDFFGHMIRKKSISEAEMVVQARTLIIAGSETTAAALSAITFFLVRNPDCLAELKKEVRTTFESSDQITGESTTGMKYLFGVIEEGLRLFPPVAFPPARHSPGAVVDGHYIPAGVTVSNNNYEMSRDPRYWQDPESYRPERWIKDGFGDNKKASQPFSIGSRACIGINLAYLELRIILAKVVLAYDMELESKHLGNWNDECKIYLLWKRPDLLVRYVPVIKTSP